jgi:hypothetical protein
VIILYPFKMKNSTISPDRGTKWLFLAQTNPNPNKSK